MTPNDQPAQQAPNVFNQFMDISLLLFRQFDSLAVFYYHTRTQRSVKRKQRVCKQAMFIGRRRREKFRGHKRAERDACSPCTLYKNLTSASHAQRSEIGHVQFCGKGNTRVPGENPRVQSWQRRETTLTPHMALQWLIQTIT